MKLLALVIGVAAAFAVGAVVLSLGLQAQAQPARLAQCYDAAVRFPEAVNPQAALDQALRAIGANPAATGDPAVQAIRANKTVLDLPSGLNVVRMTPERVKVTVSAAPEAAGASPAGGA